MTADARGRRVQTRLRKATVSKKQNPATRAVIDVPERESRYENACAHAHPATKFASEASARQLHRPAFAWHTC